MTGPQFETARLAAPIGRTGDRDDYLRAVVTITDQGLTAEAFAQQDSSMLAILADANALMVRPAGAPPAKVGDAVQVIRFDTIAGF